MAKVKPYYNLPLPTAVPYGSGLTSTNGPNGTFLVVRITKDEKNKLMEAAASVGLSMSAFIRRVSNDMADAILEDINRQEE